MACDATARLYDVDEDSVVFNRLDKTKSYDQGEVQFKARKGKLIDLDKLHESIWASRLSGGTRSGLVSLRVTAIGKIVTTNGRTILQVNGSKAEFTLGNTSNAKQAAAFTRLTVTSGDVVVQVTGLIDNYRGRWPEVLGRKPQRTRRILVTRFKAVAEK